MPEIELLLPSIVFLPFLAAGLALGVGRYIGQRIGFLMVATAAVSFIQCLQLAIRTAGVPVMFVYEWIPGLHIALSFRADPFGLFFALLICGVGTLVGIYALGYMPALAPRRLGQFYAALLAFMGAMLGVAGAGVESKAVVVTGFAGLLAGAFSMAVGEYTSVASQRDLLARQVELERREVAEAPEEEAAELALIFKQKGLSTEEASRVAAGLLKNPAHAADTLVREELGLDPDDLGSPMGAAVSSFAMFAVGAFIPVVPFLLASGTPAVAASAALAAVVLAGVGGFVGFLSGTSVWRSGGRMLGLAGRGLGHVLRRARRHVLVRRERRGHTLQTSALINEAYIRLIDQREVSWQNRAHFFAIASRLMRRILVDQARKKRYAKRGGNAQQLSLDEEMPVPGGRDMDLAALEDALKDLEAMDPRKSRIVDMRFFGGLSLEEIAEAEKISIPTVGREWRAARAWLHKAMTSGHRS